MKTDVLGLDIGGANIKYCLIRISEDGYRVHKIGSIHFPIWIRGKESLPKTLLKMKNEILMRKDPNFVALTMTAELSDVYFTKREGVEHVIKSVMEIFDASDVYVMTVNAKFTDPEGGIRNPMLVAAANWPATARLIGRKLSTSLMIDVGSTTTDIIPIKDGYPCTRGKTDTERLMYGELVYTGILRTPITAITHTVPLSGTMCRISAEKFALSGDVHLILGNITEDEYTTETADNRGKSRKECLARLARVICADIETISEDELINIAKYIYAKQMSQITEALLQVLGTHKFLNPKTTPVVVLGIGKNILARPAATYAGFAKIFDFYDLWKCPSAETAFAVALLLADDMRILKKLE